MRVFFRNVALWFVVLWSTAIVAHLVLVPFNAPPGRIPSTVPSTTRTTVAGDRRRPLDSFTLVGAPDQAAMRRRLAATQSLTCDAAASLVYRPDVILFAAHEILDEDGKLRIDFQDCRFEVKLTDANGMAHTDFYPILIETLDYGPLVEQGAEAGDAWWQSNVDDWAMARLARPVKGVTPYPLVAADDVGQMSLPGTPLVTISPPTANWHGAQTTIAGTCWSIVRGDYIMNRFPSLLFTNCYSGPGASGSPILANDGRGGFRYLGTMIAVDRPCAEGAPTCTATARSLDADLVARIKGTTAPQDGVGDAPYRAAQTLRLETARAATTEAIARELDRPIAVTDAASRKAASLYEQMQKLYADGSYDAIEPLMQQALAAFGEDGSERPGVTQLARLNGDRLRAQKRRQDAFASYAVARTTVGPVLVGYIALRMGETDDEPAQRRKFLLEAYRIGGRPLFERFGSVAEIPELGGR